MTGNTQLLLMRWISVTVGGKMSLVERGDKPTAKSLEKKGLVSITKRTNTGQMEAQLTLKGRVFLSDYDEHLIGRQTA